MAEAPLAKRTCVLKRLLSGHGSGVAARYDAASGLSQEFRMTGRVDDPEDDDWPDRSAPQFDGKAVFVQVATPPDEGQLKKICARQGVEPLCGYVSVRAGVEPELFESDRTTYEIQPVQVWLALPHDAFSILRTEVAKSYERNSYSQPE